MKILGRYDVGDDLKILKARLRPAGVMLKQKKARMSRAF
jgi:hypothetical protein